MVWSFRYESVSHLSTYRNLMTRHLTISNFWFYLLNEASFITSLKIFIELFWYRSSGVGFPGFFLCYSKDCRSNWFRVGVICVIRCQLCYLIDRLVIFPLAGKDYSVSLRFILHKLKNKIIFDARHYIFSEPEASHSHFTNGSFGEIGVWDGRGGGILRKERNHQTMRTN